MNKFFDRYQDEKIQCPKCGDMHEEDYFYNKHGNKTKWCRYCCDTHYKHQKKIEDDRRKTYKQNKRLYGKDYAYKQLKEEIRKRRQRRNGN